ncbi:hypothetical protein CGCVW01_v002632 [Colletotrichum viniferum]|nr:hypothetical protein CGCVW01_v002632 [Colletotrichum viniferum]
MHFPTFQMLGLMGVQAVLGHPVSASEHITIEKRKPDGFWREGGADLFGELNLNELTIGENVGGGKDGNAFKATVIAPGWDQSVTWILKKDYSNKQYILKEKEAYEAIDGKDVGPKFGALVYDDCGVDEEGILIEFIESRFADPNNKDDAKKALESVKRMHDAGWIHGDLTSVRNIVIRTSDNKAVLLDFALARKIKSAQDSREDFQDLALAFAGVRFDDDGTTWKVRE